jgi:hypothetical protein
MSDFETKIMRKQIYDAPKSYKEMPHEPERKSLRESEPEEITKLECKIVSLKEVRGANQLRRREMSGEYRPMHNMVTGYRKSLAPFQRRHISQQKRE